MKISKEIKFGSTLALFGANPDRFLAEGYKDTNTVEDRLKMISQVPEIKGVDFYRGWDINSENIEIIKELLLLGMVLIYVLLQTFLLEKSLH